MESDRFDRLARSLAAGSSRRRLLAGLLAGLIVPLEVAAKRGKDKRRKQRQKSQRIQAQLEPCWRVGACIPKKGANVSRCNLVGYDPTTPPDCTGCNLSRANLRGANLSGANLTKANLSGACLVDATLNGATISNNTNLYNAIFCRTIMPDGSPNNSGCGSGTACCPTCNVGLGGNCSALGSVCCDGLTCVGGTCVCIPDTCEGLGHQCGSSTDGCGGTLNCGGCAATEQCDDNRCFLEFPNCAGCGDGKFAVAVNSGGINFCHTAFTGSELCANQQCSNTADCPANQWCAYLADCDPDFPHCAPGCRA